MAIQLHTRAFIQRIFWIQSLSAYFFNSIESHMVSIYIHVPPVCTCTVLLWYMYMYTTHIYDTCMSCVVHNKYI